ncbi:hypothetical protein C8J57DRAFT_1599547 [Mycena rebaudengoi]|nr:hypothetical protein C8J57DRAFT_1599547 [Mycena rebaudengoi]
MSITAVLNLFMKLFAIPAAHDCMSGAMSPPDIPDLKLFYLASSADALSSLILVALIYTLPPWNENPTTAPLDFACTFVSSRPRARSHLLLTPYAWVLPLRHFCSSSHRSFRYACISFYAPLRSSLHHPCMHSLWAFHLRISMPSLASVRSTPHVPTLVGAPPLTVNHKLDSWHSRILSRVPLGSPEM